MDKMYLCDNMHVEDFLDYKMAYRNVLTTGCVERKLIESERNVVVTCKFIILLLF